ncbi:MAG: hypothetical protein ABJF89_05570 [Parasphingorhabdus sp.]|uniref:hypothetical protein n=1 Tax=Parasphingorhabdus sp. TaxID=2709688 RepID=UPI0032675E8F
MKTRSSLIALLACLPAPALAFSPQPESISPAVLFEAQTERTDLRYEIRFYFDLTEPACPPATPEKYRTVLAEREGDFENFISSMQDTQLLLDVNIAVQDGRRNAYARQSIVDCSYPEVPTELQAKVFKMEMAMARNQLERIKSAAQVALTRLGMEGDE